MKALVYVAPRKLELRDWPEPDLGPREALVRVGAAGVCGTDLHTWQGHSQRHIPPLVLGHEMAGVIEQVRGEVGDLKAGDRVAAYPHQGCGQCRHCAAGEDALCRRKKALGFQFGGGFAEYFKAPAKNLYRLSADTNFLEGALVEPLGCALHMVGRCGPGRGPIAIVGAGAIGLMILAVARQLNFPKAAVVEINARRREVAQRQGADLVVDPKDPESFEQLEHFFGEDGCIAVFEAAGVTPARQLSLRLVRTGGLVVAAGIGDPESPMDFDKLVRREIRIEGVFACGPSEFRTASEWVAEGRLHLKDWLSEAPLAEGQAVFEDLTRPNSSMIKAVLKP